jgi:hypothetical protein
MDGRTIDPFLLTREPSDSCRVFSVEKPTRADFRKFREMVQNFSSEYFILPTPPGKFISAPHRSDVWFTNNDQSEVYNILDNTSYVLYSKSIHHRTTRHGTRFTNPQTVVGLSTRSFRASVALASDGSGDVILHSAAPVYVPSPSRRSFLERLAALPNQSLWKHLTLDGDGSWIYEGLLANSLVMMSDGSYNEKIGRDLCSCAAVIYCRRTQQKATVTWVEKSDVYTADNYRAELLGGIALQLLVQVATDGKYISSEMRPRFGCDNKGVVHHGNHPRRPMPEKQQQADVLRYYKRLVRDAPFKCKMFHVYGHLDKLLAWDELTLEEQINIECDHLAEDSLIAGTESGDFIGRVLPNEDLVVSVGGEKISGATTPAISRHWGDEVARQHYHERGIIPWDLYHSVYWDGVEKVMKKVPEMFSV